MQGAKNLLSLTEWKCFCSVITWQEPTVFDWNHPTRDTMTALIFYYCFCPFLWIFFFFQIGYWKIDGRVHDTSMSYLALCAFLTGKILKGLILWICRVWCLCIFKNIFIRICVRIDFADFGEFVVGCLVCRISRRQIEVCFQPLDKPFYEWCQSSIRTLVISHDTICRCLITMIFFVSFVAYKVNLKKGCCMHSEYSDLA